LSLISRAWTDLFVRLEVDKSPSILFLKGQVNDALNKPLAVTPHNGRFTSAPICSRGVAGTLENRLRQHSLHDFGGADYFFVGGPESPALECSDVGWHQHLRQEEQTQGQRERGRRNGARAGDLVPSEAE